MVNAWTLVIAGGGALLAMNASLGNVALLVRRNMRCVEALPTAWEIARRGRSSASNRMVASPVSAFRAARAKDAVLTMAVGALVRAPVCVLRVKSACPMETLSQGRATAVRLLVKARSAVTRTVAAEPATGAAPLVSSVYLGARGNTSAVAMQLVRAKPVAITMGADSVAMAA